ncbi:hypothetical protein E2C01_038042 [Portunus trituberculatus]|uniref:Uncharacterized protein n=1 Tax=Portunus trituberculatus TaxID=210409 RepID=A0A5B7F9S4_PORTR|nr:hypothetical protein [Portunus trituberculatus]
MNKKCGKLENMVKMNSDMKKTGWNKKEFNIVDGTQLNCDDFLQNYNILVDIIDWLATSGNPCDLEGRNGTPSDVMSVMLSTDIEDYGVYPRQDQYCPDQSCYCIQRPRFVWLYKANEKLSILFSDGF